MFQMPFSVTFDMLFSLVFILAFAIIAMAAVGAVGGMIRHRRLMNQVGDLAERRLEEALAEPAAPQECAYCGAELPDEGECPQCGAPPG
jgi:hypothetical protein